MLSIAILVGFALRAKATYRRQSVAVIAAVTIPWVAEIVYLSNPEVLPGVDPSITIAISGALLVLALVRFRLLDLVPVARDKLVERMEDGLLVLDTESRIIDSNPAAGRIIGSAREGWIGANVRTALSAWPDMAEYLAGAVFGNDGTTNISPAGRSITVSVVTLQNRRGTLCGSLVMLRDATEQVETEAALQSMNADLRRREEALRASDARSRAIISASPVPMALNDEQQHITFLNQAFVETLGYTQEDIPTLVHWWTKAYPNPEYRQWVIDGRQAKLEHAKRTEAPFSPMETTVRCKNGTSKTVLASATSFSNSFEGNHLVVLYDITERKQAEEKIQQRNLELAHLNAELVREAAALEAANDTITRIAATDDLTGLANHRHFYEALEKAVSLARRHGSPLALASFDLDGLKRANDSAGHEAGDEVLTSFAALLDSLCRIEDLPARLGGDEFSLLMPGTDLSGGRGLAERVLAAVRSCAALEQRGVTVSGGAVAWSPDESPDDLLRRADEALYAAKRGGGDSVAGGE